MISHSPGFNYTCGSALLLLSSLAFGEVDTCRSIKNLPKVKDSLFSSARPKIIKAGWTPVKQPRSENEIGMQEVLAAGYEEVENCAATGVGACILHYKNRQGNTLKVITWGEPVKDMRVHSIECGHPNK